MNFDLTFYRTLFLRRLPAMTALFLACVVTSGIIATKLPSTYSTSALLLVQEPQIPTEMAAVMRIDPNQQLQVVERQLTTRANMLDIARQFDVFPNIRTMNPDSIVESMRNQTTIKRTGGRRGELATLMSIEFEGRSPRIVSDVVNQYVTLILAENTEDRMARAENTLVFFEQETARLSDNLDVQSARLVEFRNANAAALPDDLSYRQGRQTLLQERLARLERDITSAERQRREMVAVFEATGQVTERDDRPKTREEEQLVELNFQLEQALGIYSENNPRVTLLRSRISQLEEKISTQAGSVVGVEEGQGDVTPTMLDLTLAEIDQRVENMQQEVETVSAELAQLNQSIAATAANAIVLDALQRDYDNIQTQYNEAVSNLNRARMSERIEVTAQGQRITVIEGANVPQRPSGPNKIMIAGGGVAAGLGLAAGLFFLLELLNRTIRRPLELEKKFGIQTLAVIPYIETHRERMKRRTVLIASFTMVVIAVPAGLYYIDQAYMPLDILFVRVFDKLGLT